MRYNAICGSVVASQFQMDDDGARGNEISKTSAALFAAAELDRKIN
jgi:hypothetical protein